MWLNQPSNLFSPLTLSPLPLPLPPLQGTFFRLYYPCQKMETGERPDWIPCREYFNGLADFMKINRTISEKIFNYLFGR